MFAWGCPIVSQQVAVEVLTLPATVNSVAAAEAAIRKTSNAVNRMYTTTTL